MKSRAVVYNLDENKKYSTFSQTKLLKNYIDSADFYIFFTSELNYSDAKSRLSELNLPISNSFFLISSNGAVITDLQDDCIIASDSVDLIQAQKLMNLTSNYENTTVTIDTDHLVYIFRPSPSIIKRNEFLGIKYLNVDTLNISFLKYTKIRNISISTNDSTLLSHLKQKISDLLACYMYCDYKKNSLDINNTFVSIERAITFLINYLSVDSICEAI